MWCQKVLPLVYDDSLSYYEVLCKVVEFLNQAIDAVNENTELVTTMRTELTQFEGGIDTRMTALESYVNNYFNNLDVQTEINNKLDAMAVSGELSELVEPYIDAMTEGFDQRLTNAQNSANVANARIDEIARLEEGSTTGDAELADIRVNWSGTVTYPSAGDAVRGQVGDIDSNFKTGFNIFDKRYTLNGYYLHGVFEEHEGYWCTPLIYIGDTDKTFVRANFQTYAITRYDATKQPMIRTGTTHEWYDRYAVPVTSATYGTAYYVAFAFPSSVDKDDVMIAFTDETDGGTEDRWNRLFPNLSYQSYVWEVNSKKVVIGNVDETLDDFASYVKSEIGISNEDFFKAFSASSGATITEDAYTHSKIASFTGTSGNKTWARVKIDCRPSKAYCLEFMGYSTHPEYSADSSVGAMFVVEFFDKDGVIIGSKYNSYILGANSRGYHRYGFVSPYGAKTVQVRLTTRANTDIAVSDVTFKEVECFPQKPRSGILYDGHLGAIYVAPRNTIPSFELGKVAGYGVMITSINVTRDDVLVALHDDTIDATSDGTGNVRDFTYDELLEYDFGSWFNVAYTGTKIPTFDEVVGYISLCGMRMGVSLHGNMSNSELDQMIGIIKKYNQRNCLIKSFSLPTLEYVASKLGNFAEYMYDSNSTDPATIDRLVAMNVDRVWIEAEVAEVNTNIIAYEHNHGVGYSAYFGNDCARVKELVKLGVERFTVDTFSDIVFPLD